MPSMTTETFLWHDFETFGADPRRDRPCQFAAVRTDSRLEVIGDPVVLYCQPTRDMLPVPDACLVTGITPQAALARGVPEPQFAARIDELMSRPGTCAVGYNNFRFDDEVTRFLFWRNFIDPYAREFRNGNSRFDLIDLLRLTCALRPDGIHWHFDADGRPGFRLEDLARVNGFDVDRAHDALVDVSNTLELARLVRHRQPRLWQWALGLRERARVEALLERGEILLHASSRFPAAEFCIAPVLPLFRHPRIASQWLVWNLRHSPAPFEPHDVETLSDLMWTPGSDLPDGYQRLPVKWVRANRCPMISPTGVLDGPAAHRTGIDLEWAEAHAVRLRHEPEFVDRLRQLFARTPAGTAPDADTALYQGFVGDGDRRVAERVRQLGPAAAAELLAARPGPFADERLADLLMHWVGRHAEDRLPAAEREGWEDYRRRRLLDDPELAGITLDHYLARIEQLRAERPEQSGLLDELARWPRAIGLETGPDAGIEAH
jgi:exodeoxyribonuclease-1